MNVQSNRTATALQLNEKRKPAHDPGVKSAMIDLHGCIPEKLLDAEALQECSSGIVHSLGLQRQGEGSMRPVVRQDQKGYAAVQFFEGGSLTLHVDELGNRAFIDLFSRQDFGVDEAARYAKDFFQAKSMKLIVFAW